MEIPEEESISVSETVNPAVGTTTEGFFMGLKTSEKDGQKYSEKSQVTP